MNFKRILLSLVFVLTVISCAVNPYTGKKTMAFVSNDHIFPSAFKEYDNFLKTHKVIKGTPEAKMVKRVGRNITKAVELWLNANGYQGYLKDYKWDYNLVEDKALNAWCMPGGKIVFYTGILPIAESEAGIAAIMGHEVSHAIANHGQQRMSAAYFQQGLGMVGNAVINDDQSREIFNQSYGVGSQVLGMLPFSRSHETEADEMGLTFMAIAGYNPDAAAELWKRMKAHSGGETPDEFFSTHPSNDTRIANLTKLSGKAKAEAKKVWRYKF